MIDKAKRTLREFRHSRPGHRFEDRYNRRRQTTSGPSDPKNLLYLGGGVAIIILGALIAPVPGPGGIVAIVGLALIGSLFLPAARTLDWGELRTRRTMRWAWDVWQASPPAMKVVIALLAAIIVTTAGYGAYALVASG
ncbi:MAG: PGPGW domain-containing protein [Chloroflexota bacterium]|nr:PGPGW domain-containing protein [Chloroflexota bacterium]